MQARAAEQSRSTRGEHDYSSSASSRTSTNAASAGPPVESDSPFPGASHPPRRRDSTDAEPDPRQSPGQSECPDTPPRRSGWFGGIESLVSTVRSMSARVRTRYLQKGTHIVDALLLLATVYLFYLGAPVVAAQIHSQLSSALILCHQAGTAGYNVMLWVASLPAHIASVYSSVPTVFEAATSVRNAIASVSLKDVAVEAYRALSGWASFLAGGVVSGGREGLAIILWIGRAMGAVLCSRWLWGVLAVGAYLTGLETVRIIQMRSHFPLPLTFFAAQLNALEAVCPLPPDVVLVIHIFSHPARIAVFCISNCVNCPLFHQTVNAALPRTLRTYSSHVPC